jgi:hypothetical protein
MGYLGYFYVETKAFEIRSNVQGGVQLTEKSRGKSRSVIMAWPTIFWLVSAWDYLTNNEMEGENWRTFRFGCYAYIVQRRKNSYGKYLELSEYGGKGRRSYVIIPEGYEGKGWEDGRQQLQKLKMHHEKQKEAATLGGASEGEKGEGNTSGATTETKPVEIKAQRSYAEKVIGVQASKVAGEVAPKLIKEGANSRMTETVIAAENLASQGVERLENQENIKELLLSLQNQISSCLRKLEMGWGNKEPETKLKPIVEGGGPETRAPRGDNEAGLGPVKPTQIGETVDKSTRQYIIKRYHKIYVRRNTTRRQGRWRPKAVGWKAQPESEVGSEDGRNGSPRRAGGVLVTEYAGEGHKKTEEAKGGGEGAGLGEKAGGVADSADEGIIHHFGALEAVGQLGDMVTQSTLVAGDAAGGSSSSGNAGDSSEHAGEATDKVDETCGISRRFGCGIDKPVEELRAELEAADSDGMAGSEAESAGEGEKSHISNVEGVGQAINQFTVQPSCVGVAVGGSSGAETGVGETEILGGMVVYGETPVQQNDMGKEREADQNFGVVERDDIVEEWGEPETLEIQPLAIMGIGDHQSEARDWVLERILAFCQELGVVCDGYEKELMELFAAIEDSRINRKGRNGNKRGDKVGNRGNRELKRLECTVNYDAKGSVTASGKGRNGKFC